MKTVMATIVLVLAVGAGGCGKKQEEAAGTGSAGSAAPAGATGGAGSTGPTRRMGVQTDQDCDRLGKKSSVDSMAMTPPGTSDDQRAKLQAMSDEAGAAIAALCKSDAWSGEAVACGLRSEDPGKDCADKLTTEQMQKLETTVREIFEKGTAAMAGSAAPTP